MTRNVFLTCQERERVGRDGGNKLVIIFKKMKPTRAVSDHKKAGSSSPDKILCKENKIFSTGGGRKITPAGQRQIGEGYSTHMANQKAKRAGAGLDQVHRGLRQPAKKKRKVQKPTVVPTNARAGLEIHQRGKEKAKKGHTRVANENRFAANLNS